jgi:hypothetical protein
MNILGNEAFEIVKEKLKPHRELGIDIEIKEYTYSNDKFEFVAELYDIDDPLNESGQAHESKRYYFTIKNNKTEFREI